MFKRFSDLIKPKPASDDPKNNRGYKLQRLLFGPKPTGDTSTSVTAGSSSHEHVSGEVPQEHEQPTGVTKISDSSDDPNILQSMHEFMKQAHPILQNSDKNLDLAQNVLRDYERFRTRIGTGKIIHSNPGNDQNLIGDSDSHSNSQTITTDSSPISWEYIIQAYNNLEKLTAHNQKPKQKDNPVDQPSQEQHQEYTSGGGSQEPKLPDGITKIGDSYIIDVSKFDPAKIEALSQRDFALIDLRRIKGFKHDVSNFKTTGLRDIPKPGSPIRDDLDTVTALISDTLEDSHEYKTYLSSFSNYKCAFMYLYIFRVMQETGKITHSDLSKHVQDAHHFLRELILDNQDQIDSTPIDQLAHEPSPERASGKLPTGVTEKGDLYIIDASKIDLSTGDLSTLNPSREITYDTSNLDLTKFKHDFSSINPEVIESMENFMTLAKNILKGRYKREVYKVYSTIYERVLSDYCRFGIMSQIRKSDLSEEYLKLSIETAKCFLEKLMEANIKVDRGSKSKKSDYPEAKFLFSENETERDIAEAIGITRAYRDLFQKNGVKAHDEEEFRTFEFLSKEIVNTSIAALSSEQQQDFLQSAHNVNQSLREIAEGSAKTTPKDSTKNSALERINQDDLNPFQLALKKAIVETRNYDDWAQKWIREYGKYFNLDEHWVKESMGQLGIKKKDIIESNELFLGNEDVLTAISGASVNNIVYDYGAKKALEVYEELAKANAKLRYIHNQLHDGIPVKSSPKHINGRDVLPTPGNRLNCLIHSLIKVGNPELDWETIKDMARPIRDILVEEGLAKDNEMLELKDAAGERLVSILSKRKLIDTTRDIRVYQLTKDMRMQCYQISLRKDADPDPAKPPYAVFLKVDDHFDAMSELKGDGSIEDTKSGKKLETIEDTKSGKKLETIEDIIDKMNMLVDKIKIYNENHQEDLEKALSGKGMKLEDYENLRYIARTLSQLKSGPGEDMIIDASKQAINFLESIDKAMPADLRVLAEKEIAQRTETDRKR